MRTFHPLWLLAAACALTACTAILNQSADQCSTDPDCASFGAGFVCAQDLCKGPANNSSGGSSGAVDPDGGPDGSCAPTPNKASNPDYYNDPCTNATCIPFDNCARLGLCDGAALPALIAPPDGGV